MAKTAGIMAQSAYSFGEVLCPDCRQPMERRVQEINLAEHDFFCFCNNKKCGFYRRKWGLPMVTLRSVGVVPEDEPECSKDEQEPLAPDDGTAYTLGTLPKKQASA